VSTGEKREIALSYYPAKDFFGFLGIGFLLALRLVRPAIESRRRPKIRYRNAKSTAGSTVPNADTTAWLSECSLLRNPVFRHGLREIKRTQRIERWVLSRIWLPFVETYRTMCLAPEPEFRRVLEDVRELHLVAW